MLTFVQPGESLTLTAPSGSPGGVVSGEPYLIGSLLVIALETADAGDPFDCQAEGVYFGNKVAIEAWTEAQIVRWNDTLRLFTETVGSPENPIVGSALVAVSAAVTITSNAGGSPLDLTIADNVITVADYTGLSGKTITITRARELGLASVVVVLTEGVDFVAATSNALTATHIATAIAAVLGLGAVASTLPTSPVTEIVTVTADAPVRGQIRLDGVAR